LTEDYLSTIISRHEEKSISELTHHWSIKQGFIPMEEYGKNPKLSYNQYLKVPQLIELQETLSEPTSHDELLFIVIHQTYELWFKQVLHEIDGGKTRANLRAKWRVSSVPLHLVGLCASQTGSQATAKWCANAHVSVAQQSIGNELIPLPI